MSIYHEVMKRPIMALVAYFTVLILILLSMTGGDDSSEAKHVDTSKAEKKIETAEVTKPEVAKLVDSTEAEMKTAEAEVKTESATKVKTEEKVAEAATAEVPKVEEAKNAQFNEMSAEELLLMAREAYWNNGLEESEEIYLKLVELNPDVTDYKGELGNVHWRKGEPKKAAALYAEIALPMIEAGENARVANMVGFIGSHYPEKATEIHNALEASK